MSSPLLDALRRAVEQAPDDVPLRLHLAELLLDAGERSEALSCVGAALQRDPTSAAAQVLMARCLGVGPAAALPPSAPPPSSPLSAPDVPPSSGFDWSAAEAEVRGVAGPMFVTGDGDDEPEPESAAFDVERSGVTLADVGGMTEVKARLDAAFLAPLRNPDLRRLYGKSLRGGLLLYGPPGCGKTFLARAVAGELGAAFIPIGLADVLDPYIGNSERNVREAFQLARRSAPCVLFFDEIDSIGQRRSLTRNNAMRNTVNQLLTELDGVDATNEGVFVLAATNQPWDVDPALRRPGRLDRTLLVLPPDLDARATIFTVHLRDRPVESIDVRRLAQLSDGLSGADIRYACELAAESALMDSARTGSARLIGMTDVEGGLRQIRPSIGPWLDSARNLVLFGDDDGTYRDLKAYLKSVRRL